MVKNKTIRGRARRSSRCKTKPTGSQTASSKDLTPLDDPADSDISAISPELWTTGQGQLGFPDRVYLLASVIFQNNHQEKPASHQSLNYGKERGLPLPEVKDEEMQRTAYELAFNTLKYQELLEDIMIDSCIYLTQPTPDHQMSLVAVMLYDFQDRKFLPRKCPKEEILQEVGDMENNLLRCKTKLAASLARFRIKHDLMSIECILPESVRTKQERSRRLPLYAWVNTLKSSLDEVQRVLKTAGFSQVKSIGQLEGQTFCQDPHCGDILVVPAQLKAQLYSTKLLSHRKLIIQDKSCSLGPNAVCSLLPKKGDVLMMGCFSGLTVSHTVSLIAEKQKANGNDQPTVYVCVSDRTNAQREDLQQAVRAMGCKNVKLIPEDFQSLRGDDKRLQRVRVILLTPKCSVSAVSNPVEFILRGHGDTDLLQDLSWGSIAQSKLEALVAQQRKDIDHALKFPKVLAVVYSTCSSYPEENKEVVSRALEQAKARPEQKGEPKQANFRLSSSPFSIPEGPEGTDPFFMSHRGEVPEPVVKETPHKVLLRANAKGIRGRIGSNHQLTREDQHGHTKRMTKQTHARTLQPRRSVCIQSKNHETKGSNSTTSREHQELPNRRQSSQGKAKALHLQASKNTVSSSFSSLKQDSMSPSSSSKPETVLLRANAKGILDRIGSNHQLTREDQHGHTKTMTKQTHAPTLQPRCSVCIQSKNHETKGSNSTTSREHQEFPNRQQSSQGKAKALHLQASKNTVSSSFSSLKQDSMSPSSSSKPETVLLRANAKGILDRIVSNHQLTREDQHGHTKTMTKQTHAPTLQPRRSVCIQSKNHETKGSNSTTSREHQEFPNRQQSSQGKAKALHLQASKNTVSSSFSSLKQDSMSPSSSSKPETVLLRANAKGILDRIVSNHQLTREVQHGHTKRMTKQTHAPTLQPRCSVCIQSKNHETKGSNSTTSREHQKFPNRLQSSQGKAKALHLQASKNTVSSSFSSLKQDSMSPSSSSKPETVLLRANAKGILDRIVSNHQLTREVQHGHTKRMTKQTHAPTLQPRCSVCIQSKNHETKGSNSTTSREHQKFPNRLQSSQGKAKALHLQASKNTVSSSFSSLKQDSMSSSSSSKPETITSKKNITSKFNITTYNSLSPAPHATPLAPVVRPCRAHHQEFAEACGARPASCSLPQTPASSHLNPAEKDSAELQQQVEMQI